MITRFRSATFQDFTPTSRLTSSVVPLQHDCRPLVWERSGKHPVTNHDLRKRAVGTHRHYRWSDRASGDSIYTAISSFSGPEVAAGIGVGVGRRTSATPTYTMSETITARNVVHPSTSADTRSFGMYSRVLSTP